jgi:hypothetical protein
VGVAASPHNRKRVTIDVGQASGNGTGGSRRAPIRDTGPVGPEFPPSRDNQRLGALAQLGQLRNQGVLTDAEFAAQKARILAE